MYGVLYGAMLVIRPSFSPWTCELCSQEMNVLTENYTKYFKIINKFDLFCSFCAWKVLLTMEFQQIGTLCYSFSCLRGKTSTKVHKKSGWPCRGSQEGKKNKNGNPFLSAIEAWEVYLYLNENMSRQCIWLDLTGLYWTWKDLTGLDRTWLDLTGPE